MEVPRFLSEKEYKEKYAQLGVERMQEGTKGYVELSRKNKKKQQTVAQVDLARDYEKFWFPRNDSNWVSMPMRSVYSRRERKVISMATVNKIFVYLAPQSGFNPRTVWAKLKADKQQQLQISEIQTQSSKKTIAKADQIIAENTLKGVQDNEIAEVTRIRNSKDNLIDLIRQVSTKIAKDILLIEILKKVMTDKNDKNMPEIFDLLWAIENVELSKVTAPKPKNSSDILLTTRDSSLVYDNLKDVEKILKDAKKIRNDVGDIVSFQLNEMSDRLPPLSPYIFDFKLDAWQIRALEFIDAGKSLVICAPTSSGKTVLSSYVALIDSLKKVNLVNDRKNDKKGKVEIKMEQVDGEDVEIEEDEDEDEEDDEDDEDEEDGKKVGNDALDFDVIGSKLVKDRFTRLNFRKNNPDGFQRVLFIAPSEPLVWQVAALFTKLLREEGGESKVAIVTNQMAYYSIKKFNVMPQIVVGTPLAIESALTKPRGLVGRWETIHKPQLDILPGGFDHFDWVIFDEVHALDNQEGDALQRIIRAMNCKFLALSATVGNADELLGWMERVKGEQLVGVESMTVLPSEAHHYGIGTNITPAVDVLLEPTDKKDSKDKKNKSTGSAAVTNITVKVTRQDGNVFVIPQLSRSTTVLKLKISLLNLLTKEEPDVDSKSKSDVVKVKVDQEQERLELKRQTERLAAQLQLELNGNVLENNNATLDSLGQNSDFELALTSFNVHVVRTVDQESLLLRHVSPQCSLADLRRHIVRGWSNFTADSLQVLQLVPFTEQSAFGPVEYRTTKEIKVGDMVIDVEPGQEIEKGTLFLIRDESGIEVVTVVKKKETFENTLYLQSHIMKKFAVNTLLLKVRIEDMKNSDANLGSYGIQSGSVVQVRSLVNLLVHQGRFINLQRYLWRNSKLESVSPLAAVSSLELLQSGMLDNSSLSFTSKDSYCLWQEIEKIYPASAITHLDPHNFFAPNTRITLQDTKEYEDVLKKGLRKLASQFPVETRELLYKFRIEDPNKEVDLCELCLDLKEKKMSPSLVFHLNAFEAIAVFKQLLAGIEWRQKRDFPTYYQDLQAEKELKKKNFDKQQKNTGGNAKEAEEKAQSGEIETDGDFTVDVYEPHPKYRFTKGSVMTAEEFTELSDEMERLDGFPKREKDAMKNLKGMNEAVLSHALMRGLHRGIGLYIDEVSAPAYRRAVQKLASQGKLGVVISDDSLAFGVNMPFRTCVFCGEMAGRLTPLMAQQMSGRAGRRGLDTQGNLVYAGASASFIRSIMVGHIANITGENYSPRYETIFLQGMLSTRHVGWSRLENNGGQTLDEYTHGVLPAKIQQGNYCLSYSKQVLADLGIIVSDAESGGWVPCEEWEVLTMVWELRNTVGESVTLGRLLPEIFEAIKTKSKEFINNKASDSYNQEKAMNKEKDAKYVPFFFGILLQLIDRHVYDPTKSPIPPLHEHQNFSPDHPIEHNLFKKWDELFRKDQETIPEYLSHLRSPVPPGSQLDGTLYACMLDRHLVHTLSEEQKQDIKARIWHVGTTVKTMLNSLWPNKNYCDVMANCLRTCFRNLYYLNTELIRGQIDFLDVSSAARETRADRELAGQILARTDNAKDWKDAADVLNKEYLTLEAVSFCEAFVRVNEWKQLNPNPSTNQTSDMFERTINIFSTLKLQDLGLLKLALDWKEKDLKMTVPFSTPARISSQHLIGTLLWFCTRIIPSSLSKFPLYLKEIIEFDGYEVLVASDVKTWLANSTETNSSSLPSGCNITFEEIEKVKTSKGMVAFVQWLDMPEEDDDDEEEENDDDEED